MSWPPLPKQRPSFVPIIQAGTDETEGVFGLAGPVKNVGGGGIPVHQREGSDIGMTVIDRDHPRSPRPRL